VFYGETSSQYTQYVDTASLATSATITGLKKGATYYFVVKAYTTQLSESDNSPEIAWLTPFIVDLDEDHIDDEWETAHFNQLNVANGAASDSDQDGTSDLDEFVAGTQPDDPNDLPSLEVELQDGRMVVVYKTIAAAGVGYENRTRYYTLERCVDLRSGQWQPVSGNTDILAAGQEQTYVPSPTEPAAYYKTRIRLN
jgi:hypothetical protein